LDDRAPFATAPGAFVGTPGYASPEQIRQQTIDQRTDIFSLGVVLYEALAGRAPFLRASPGDTLSATLADDPPQPSQIRPGLTAAIDEVVRACLEKDPERRFASAADLALTLRAMEPLVGERVHRRGRQRRRRMFTVAATALALMALLASLITAAVAASASAPTYRRATFVRGTITSARFKPGSGEVVYDATINGQPRELFATIPGTAEARSLGLRGAELLAISRSGEMAVSLNRHLVRGFVGIGTLAVVSEGRAPRELLDNVHAADWNRDGTSLAVVRSVGGRARLEFPVRTPVFETSGWISDPRFSPDGSRIAFVDHPVNADDRGRVMLIEQDQSVRTLSTEWVSILGLAWSASGREVWFTAQDRDGLGALRAVDLSARQRVVAQVPARLRLLDIRRDGQVLLARDDVRLEAYGIRAGDADERNLSWLDWSLARDISRDGTRLLITEFGEAAANRPGIFMRAMDGSRPARLGTGSGLALSPDGGRVLALWNSRLSLVPVGPGEVTPLPNDGIASYDPWAAFFPDGRRIVFTGAEAGDAGRVYVQPITGGAPVPITSAGFRLASPGAVSPSGEWVVVVDRDERLFLCSSGGGALRPLPGALPGEALARWDRDGRAVFLVETASIPARVFRVTLDGRREQVKMLAPDDLSGAIAIHRLVMTADGEAYAYTLERQLSDLYVATGLHEQAMRDRIPWLGSLFSRLQNRTRAGATSP
jgi:hypothetical protein